MSPRACGGGSGAGGGGGGSGGGGGAAFFNQQLAVPSTLQYLLAQKPIAIHPKPHIP